MLVTFLYLEGMAAPVPKNVKLTLLPSSDVTMPGMDGLGATGVSNAWIRSAIAPTPGLHATKSLTSASRSISSRSHSSSANPRLATGLSMYLSMLLPVLQFAGNATWALPEPPSSSFPNP